MLEWVIFCLILELPYVSSHASYLADSSYCSTPLTSGTYFMGNRAVSDSSLSVTVSRGATALLSGSTYSVGEHLTVGLSATNGIEFIFETANAAFASGYCNNKRIYTKGSIINMPSDGSVVTIWAAWDDSQGNPVRITPKFTLIAATVTSSPSTIPTIHPTFPPTFIPSPLPSNMPTLLPSYMPSSRPTMKPTMIPSTRPSPRPTTHIPTRPVLDTAPPTISQPPTVRPSSLQPSSTPSGIPTFAPSSNPSYKPTSKPTSSPTAHATVKTSPTSYPTMRPNTFSSSNPTKSTSSYSAEISFDLSGLSTSDFATYAEDTVRSLLASYLSIDKSRVIILSFQSLNTRRRILTSQSVASTVPALPTQIMSMIRSSISLLLVIRLQLLGFTTLAGVGTAKNSCVKYLNTSMASDLSSQTGLTVTSIQVIGSTVGMTNMAFDYSCKLADSMTLSWSILKNNAGIKFQVMNADPVQWFSAGIIRNSLVMVPTTGPHHSVYLYAPDSGMAGLFTMDGKDAGNINVDDRARVNTSITDLQSAVGVSLM